MPTERPPFVSEVNANVSVKDPHGRILGFLNTEVNERSSLSFL
jgi:hypothetical protein